MDDLIIRIHGSEFDSDSIDYVEFPIMTKEEMLIKYNCFGLPVTIFKHNGMNYKTFSHLKSKKT